LTNHTKKFVFTTLCLQYEDMDKPIKKRKITFARFSVRVLAISASTLALFDFLKGDYQAGGLLTFGWLAIVTAEKRMFNMDKTNEDP
tara:strand:+ start:444 stop:704 length:261 start_codon:yes stop_codon:yes gene_type:complete